MSLKYEIVKPAVTSRAHIVLLHGWGMNSEVWASLIPEISAEYSVQTIDLPGFGNNHFVLPDDYNLFNLASMVAEVIPDNSVVIGWSLGGLVAQCLAINHSDKVRGLICVASSPKFLADEQWPGIDAKVLSAFAAQLRSDASSTIERFLAIQALGSDRAKNDILTLKKQIASRPTPDSSALKGGLRILKQADVRNALEDLSIPTLRIYGAKDSLVPVAALERIERCQPNSSSMLFPKASHAPFISHPSEFNHAILEFLYKKIV